jgi:UDP-glucose 6-dehydrogenase
MGRSAICCDIMGKKIELVKRGKSNIGERRFELPTSAF